MTPADFPPDPSPEDRPASEELESLQEIRLGDALGDDDQLSENLVGMGELLESDAPGTGGFGIRELWALVCKIFKSRSVAVADLTRRAIKRFSDKESRIIRAKAESKLAGANAYAKKKKADGDAEIDSAQADRIRADSEEIRAQTKRKNEYIEELKRRNIDWYPGMDEDVLRIVVKKPEGLPPPDDE